MKMSFAAAAAALSLLAFPLKAQELVTTVWEAYGVSFQAPAGFSVEDDSEEGYVLSDPTYYITVQLLEGEGLQPSDLAAELKSAATDDEVTQQSAVSTFELPQFHGVQLFGECETDRCVYSYLLAKDNSCAFYVSILYKEQQDVLPARILRSFRFKDEE